MAYFDNIFLPLHQQFVLPFVIMKPFIYLIFIFLPLFYFCPGANGQSSIAETNYQKWLKYRYSDAKSAAVFLKSSAEQGHPKAQIEYFEALLYGRKKGIRKNEKKAFEVLISAAESGNVDAMWKSYDFHKYYPYGRKNYFPDENTLNGYFLKALAANHPDALCEEGRLVRFSENVGEEQMKEAALWYEKALLQDSEHVGALMSLKEICNYLPYSASEAFDKGKEQERQENYEFANIYYRKAAKEGSFKAMRFLAVNLCTSTKSIKCEKNNDEAFKLASQAASGNDATSMALLGSFYEDGIGVSEDWNKAREWYLKAKKKGYSKAGDYLAQLDKKVEERQQAYAAAEQEQRRRASMASSRPAAAASESQQSTGDKLSAVLGSLERFTQSLNDFANQMAGNNTANVQNSNQELYGPANKAGLSEQTSARSEYNQSASESRERERIVEETCYACDGHGLIHSSSSTNRSGCSINPRECHRIECDACGKIHCHHQHKHNICYKCEGTGKLFKTASGGRVRFINGDSRQVVCKLCNGSGRETKKKTCYGGLGEHLHTYCKVCRKSHCHHLTSHKDCSSCSGKGYITQVYSNGKWQRRYSY